MTTLNLSSTRTAFSWSHAARYAPAIVATGGVLLLLIHRNSTLFFNPQLWAEDIWIYFVDDRLYGAEAILRPYAGYVQVGTRLGAFFVGFFPAVYAPRLYATIFLAAIFTVASLVYTSPAFKGWGKPLATVALIGAPAGSEVFFGLCYIQWAMCPVLAIALYERSPGVWRGTALTICAALVGLSAPFLVIATPLVAFKLWRDRSIFAVALAALALVCCALQIPDMLHRAAAPKPMTIYDRELLSTTLLYRWYFGIKIVTISKAVAVAVPTAILLLWYASRTLRLALREKVYFLGYGAALLFVGCASIDIADSFQYGPYARYFYWPIVMFIWTVIAIEQAQPRATVSLAAVAAFLAITYAAHGQRLDPHYQDAKWEQTAECLATADACSVPVNPSAYGPKLLPSDKQVVSMTRTERDKMSITSVR